MRKAIPPLQRLMSKVAKDPVTGCWNWVGYKMASGYGRLKIKGKMGYAHRLAANIFLDMPPDSKLDVCHHFDNPRCINPEHLFLGDAKINSADMMAKGRGRFKRPPGVAFKPKLTPKQVREIREQYANGVSRLSLARSYGLNWTTISNAAKRITWKHV